MPIDTILEDVTFSAPIKILSAQEKKEIENVEKELKTTLENIITKTTDFYDKKDEPHKARESELILNNIYTNSLLKDLQHKEIILDCMKFIEKFSEKDGVSDLICGIRNLKYNSNLYNIKNIASEETVETINLYGNNTHFILNFIGDIIANNHFNTFDKIKDILYSEELVENLSFFEKDSISKDNKRTIRNSITDIAIYTQNKDLMILSSKFLANFHENKQFRNVCYLIQNILIKHDKSCVEELKDVINIFDKYDGSNIEVDIHDIINKKFEYIGDLDEIKIPLKTLLEDRTYSQLVKSNNVKYKLNFIFDNKYQKIYSNILDDDVKNNLSEDNITSVLKAYETVTNLHDDKSEDSQEKVKEGFFRIMNNKIASKDSLKDKLDIMKRWSSEVYKQMVKNRNELRYVYGSV
jgi:hypothetical protein